MKLELSNIRKSSMRILFDLSKKISPDFCSEKDKYLYNDYSIQIVHRQEYTAIQLRMSDTFHDILEAIDHYQCIVEVTLLRRLFSEFKSFQL